MVLANPPGGSHNRHQRGEPLILGRCSQHREAGASLLGLAEREERDGFLVGTVQGGSQALSRSLFASMIPRQRSSEFFAFWGVFEKFAGIIGPAMFAYAIGQTGSSQIAVLSVIVFFAAGALLLTRVKVEEGQRIAREAEAALAGSTAHH